MLCYWVGIYCNILLDTVGYQLWCVLHLIVYIPQPSWVSCNILWRPLMYWICFHPCCCIIVLLICNDGCGFWVLPFCRCWGLNFLGSFTLGDAVVLGGLLSLTFTLVCAISLWEVSSHSYFCLFEDICQITDSL